MKFPVVVSTVMRHIKGRGSVWCRDKKEALNAVEQVFDGMFGDQAMLVIREVKGEQEQDAMDTVMDFLKPLVVEFNTFDREVHQLPDQSVYAKFGLLPITAGQMRALRDAMPV